MKSFPGFTRFWQRLHDPEQSRVTYLARAWIADVPLSLLIVAMVGWITGIPAPSYEGYPIARVLLAMCVFAPVGETLLLALLLWILRYVLPTRLHHWRALIAAALWALFHSLAKRWWGVEVFWPFVIFSICYVTWEKKSIWQAIALTTILHIAHNAVPAVMLIISRYSSQGV